MRRARSLLLDEYIQTKAKNLTINKPNKVGLQNQFYSPNYLKAKKPVATLSSQDYDEHLGNLYLNFLYLLSIRSTVQNKYIYIYNF